MCKRFLVLALVFIGSRSIAQVCSCVDDFKWLKETFEQNDAGFQYVIDQKGEDAYEKHCETYVGKVSTVPDKKACVDVLADWLQFFRQGHLWIGLVDQPGSESSSKDKEQGKDPKDIWETYSFNEKEFVTYVKNIKEPGYEGIWSSPPYTIGIKKVDEDHIGFIISSENPGWKKEQVKLRFREENGGFSATYFMKDHSAKEFTDVELIGNNYLQVGFVTLKRLEPGYPADDRIDHYFNLQTTEVPLFQMLSDNTALVRIPSFSHEEKAGIDSLLDANWETLTHTKNLILDLRNNGGGSDVSYEKLLPLLYTNPIRTVGVELLSTPLNNQRMVEFMNDPDWSEEEKIWAKNSLDLLQHHIGEFVNVENNDVTIEELDTVLPNPKQIGIIINDGNGSTTEQFLLAAKQSKKVKLFGTTTVGVLDVSNMYFVDSPCKDIKLGYSLSRSMRIPDMTIDEKGIQPDYYIDKSISKYDWIDFVQGVLNEE